MTSGRQSKKRRQNSITSPQEQDARPIEQKKQSISLAANRFSGPIPPPAHLEHYEKILPGMANRIMEMAEKEQNHRHECDHILFPEAAKAMRRGQIITASILLAAIVTTIPLAIWANSAVAIIVGAGGFFPWLINTFLLKQSTKSDNDEPVAQDKKPNP